MAQVYLSMPVAALTTTGDDDGSGEVTVSGEQKKWHKISVDLDGPFANENDTEPNPFLDFRMTCEFTHVSDTDGDNSKTTSYQVPGYFAADGDAAETSAKSGTKWRCNFTPDRIGTWKYRISFVKGQNISISLDETGERVAPYDGRSGEFQIGPTDKTGNDFRAIGQLRYIGQHYLQASETKRAFIKAGPDAPETLLAFADFDDTYSRKPKGKIKNWEPHVRDWKQDDPSWKNGKGKGLIGAINYLASKGVNSFSFLTYNVGGDGHNVWPHINDTDRLHFDCSKLDQWGIVMDHAQNKGLLMHVKLQETENDDRNIGHGGKKTGDVPAALDGGDLGVQRKLYLRELVARFGHALALEWNLGEENTQSTQQQIDMATFLNRIDSSAHSIVVHTYPKEQKKRYKPLLGNGSTLTGASLQNMWDEVHQRTLKWVKASAESGRPWIVANDEQGNANNGVPPDPGYEGFDGAVTMKDGRKYDLHDIRKQTLWGNIMAGGAGVMYYFGYKLKQSDLVCEDFRSRDQSWNYCGHALNFFQTQNLPLQRMTNMNSLVGNKSNEYGPWCLAEQNNVYLVYLPDGGETKLDLTDAEGVYTLDRYNPRTGGQLASSAQAIPSGSELKIAAPTTGPTEDWVFLIRKVVHEKKNN